MQSREKGWTKITSEILKLFRKNLIWYTKALTAEVRIAWLEEQLKRALEQSHETQKLLRESQEQLQMAQARIKELEKQKTRMPAFVKANVAKPKERSCI